VTEYLHYFAFGSNLTASRLIARVGRIEDLGRATLPDYRLSFSKSGRDGSSKCNLDHTKSSDDVAEGVVYRMPVAAKPLLDRFEGVGKGYRVATVDVALSAVESVSCFVYLAVPPLADKALLPYCWYHDFVLKGGEAHGFSDSWLEWVRAHSFQTDANIDRSRRNQRILNADFDQALSLFATGEAT